MTENTLNIFDLMQGSSNKAEAGQFGMLGSIGQKDVLNTDQQEVSFDMIFGSMLASLSPEQSGQNETLLQEIPAQENLVQENQTIPQLSTLDSQVGNTEQIKVDENVLAFTNLSETFNVRDPNKVKIYWVENKTYLPVQQVLDLNQNGIYDYIEWLVPHLSNQTFDIIRITKAEHLDANREFISDIYDEVKALDDVWSETIPSEHYVRVTFERNLTSDRDITLYPRIVNGSPRVEVYEVNGSDVIAELQILFQMNIIKYF